MAYPPIEPYETGMLETGNGNLVYWETCGNPHGLPVLVVHGGPGSGCSARPLTSLQEVLETHVSTGSAAGAVGLVAHG